MGDTHRIRFEPVDLEIEVTEDETILDAAFRQGVSLMHGCREGQCSACKSFLLDGDVQMDRYSTFALADYESEEGYVLLCKSHAYSDCEIELINFDEDELHNAVPLQQVRTRVIELAPLTNDIVSLKLAPLEPGRYEFKPGQYSEVLIPGTDEHRSFSMATTPATPGVIEFIIKCYPGGRFSALLTDGLVVGDELVLHGPYGSFTVKPDATRDIVCIGGGAGMAPILSLLRHLAEIESPRRVRFYYGARTVNDLFYLPEIAELATGSADFDFVPALSEETAADWDSIGVRDGDFGFVTDVVDRREADLTDADIYLCGPPPMVDAALALLDSKGVARERIHFDKFTTAVSP
ncbi:NADH:ubiquinone reductase (Na(+)-transporting) subunit F [Nocardia australiensis]|uniref:NADH:ubiquinone reductase (Na(+)-transporting) subunit F n=1 Tax=Nocardia australiensis TaxID=2887191 RepID=UPI001D157154|nr:2Fe-2S iron-sulfur cluster-binding protein [Nocardia australiensis]